jgi:hypothetical protein
MPGLHGQLALRRQALLLKIARQRLAIAQEVGTLTPALQLADGALSLAEKVRRRPWWLALGCAAGMLLFRRRNGARFNTGNLLQAALLGLRLWYGWRGIQAENESATARSRAQS